MSHSIHAAIQALAEYVGTNSGIMGSLNRASATVLDRGGQVLSYLGEHIVITVGVLLGIAWIWHSLTRTRVR